MVVLRVRFTGGDQVDLTYEQPGTSSEVEVVEHVISTLSQDSGVIRCRHGGRLVALFGRGVAALEVGPQGPVL
jgi:hypothetical protein